MANYSPERDNSMELKNYPTAEKVKEAIRNLKKTEFPKFETGMSVENYVESITQIIIKEFGIFPNNKQPFQCNKFLNSFFRVRPYKSFKNINLFREHSYPPVDCIKMGRCNFPLYPVFYCSDNPGTALLEVARNTKNNHEKYCVSNWQMVQSDRKVIFESFLQVPLPSTNFYNLIKQNLIARINEPFLKSFNKKLSKEQEDGLIEYLSYLDSSFLNDTDYSLSASLAHRTMFANHELKSDVLMYPSVQSLNNGVNLAIRPNFVDNNLRLNHLYILHLNDFDLVKGLINVTIFNYGEVINDNIVWRSIDPEDQKYINLVKEDFGSGLHSEFKINNLP